MAPVGPHILLNALIIHTFFLFAFFLVLFVFAVTGNAMTNLLGLQLSEQERDCYQERAFRVSHCEHFYCC